MIRVPVVAARVGAVVYCLGLLVASGAAQPLNKVLRPGPGSPGQDSFEVRFGAFAHDIGGPEKGSADFNVEFVFPRLWHADDGWNPLSLDSGWNWLIPRPHIGGMLNTAGRTSYLYGGALWTLDFTDRLFLETFLGGALHNGSLGGDATHAALGCRLLYHLGASAGYRILPKWSVMFTYDHISNGKGVFSNCARNMGLNQYGVRVSYSF